MTYGEALEFFYNNNAPLLDIPLDGPIEEQLERAVEEVTKQFVNTAVEAKRVILDEYNRNRKQLLS